MSTATKEPPKTMPVVPPPPRKEKHWTEKISRSGYFLGALLFHLILFLLIATLVIFPPFHPPADEFQKTYVPASAPPPPPPPQSQSVTVPTPTVEAPTAIMSPTATPSFTIPPPDITPTTTPPTVAVKMTTTVKSQANSISDTRLTSIQNTETKSWGRSKQNIQDSDNDPRKVIATFPVYVASYADGDWNCNIGTDDDGKIVRGSIPNLIAKVNEWSHGNLKGAVVPEPLDLGGSDLMDKKPPFIFFTGHKDFTLTDQEIQNLRDYLQVGGAIWGDNTLAGRGSRFDVAFRREMKRVVPDVDKNFQPLKLTDDLFTKSWFPLQKVPPGMNYYTEDIQHLDIDGKLAILYTPNDYGDMLYMRILPGDTDSAPTYNDVNYTSPLLTNQQFLFNSNVFFRNFNLPAVLEVDKLGMNIIGYLLVRFDKELLLAP